MAWSLAVLTSALFVLQILSSVKATALTTTVAPNERLCFYADVDKAGEKLGVRPNLSASVCHEKLTSILVLQFYFAVSQCLVISYKHSHRRFSEGTIWRRVRRRLRDPRPERQNSSGWHKRKTRGLCLDREYGGRIFLLL